MLLTYYSYEKINSLLGLKLSYFWLGFALQLVSYWKLKTVASLSSKYSLLRAKTLLKGDSIEIGRDFLKSYLHFDCMTADQRELSRNEEAHTVITEDLIDLPVDFIARSFVPMRKRRMLTYWGTDEKGIFYILRHSAPPV